MSISSRSLGMYNEVGPRGDAVSNPRTIIKIDRKEQLHPTQEKGHK